MATTHSAIPPPSQVDVGQAEHDFQELSRQLSRQLSNRENGNEKSSFNNSARTSGDLEKAEAKEAFDLREYLQSSTDANQNAGIKHKHVGVTWEDLQCEVVGGMAGMKFHIETFGESLLTFWMVPFLWLWSWVTPFLPSTPPPLAPLISKTTGVLKPGEMCLVLGTPGSGASEFLMTMANNRAPFANVSGEVLYAGLDAGTMAQYYGGEVLYNGPDDVHVPTLTVGQTLQFVLRLKTPGPAGRQAGIKRKDFDKEVLDTLLKMLNISHTKHTLVGDAFVRGVSGGEKKRVSIAEMMATRARVQCWDNATRGLDASTALDFVKSLRVMTDVLGQTTFVTLYQAGEGIYDLFDKVMVLSGGHTVFYGAPSQARAHFESIGYRSLPRQSTADYLTGCTDPHERQFAVGRSADNVPSTPDALEQAFRDSSIAKELYKSVADYKQTMASDKTDQDAFRAAVLDDKKKGVTKTSPYTRAFHEQVWAMTVRVFQEKLQDRFQIFTSFGLTTLLALILGSAYFNQPLNSNGGFTRSSTLFIGLLTTCLDGMAEMPILMLGRPLMGKHLSYRLYRPAAVAVGNTLADLPFSAVRFFIFDVILYFMAHLKRNGGAFWTFHLISYMTYLVVQAMFRTVGAMTPTFDVAFRLITACMPFFIEYSGYIIPLKSMQVWLFWLYYLNPLAYAFQALMENEFGRIDLLCDGEAVVPRNVGNVTKYPTDLGENQACTLYGSEPGNPIVSGAAYIRAGWQMEVSDLWIRCFLVLLLFLVFFLIAQVVALELYPMPGGPPGGIAIYAKDTPETKKRNEALEARKDEKAKAKDLADKASGSDVAVTKDKEYKEMKGDHRKAFTWESLNYDVPVPGGTRRLLDDVYGYVKPGTLTALMGASGAGKTTCLDVLAQRKNIGVISGDLLVDGRPLSSDFARGTAYAEQMDVHEVMSTVREALRFSAYLRQPAEVSKADKDAYVEEIIELLELQNLTEALVFSLSLEARKRLTIGVELASKPELLLFLDEPTSGLDSQSAWNMVRFLRKLASQGQAILCTIHQPSSLLFESFDRLLLLESGGHTVYFGDIGQDSHTIREYFAAHGAPCPSNVNPAEFMLEAIGAGLTPRIGNRDWKDIWRESNEYQQVLREISDLKATGLSYPEEKKKSSTYATSFLFQVKTVVQRENMSLWRNPGYIFSRLFIATFISLFISLSQLQLGNSVRDLQLRIFGIFFVAILPAVVISQLEPVFIFKRSIFNREASSKIYSPWVFALGQILSEMPYNILCAIFYWVLFVYPMGFGKGSAGTNGTGFQLLVVLFMMLFGVSFGQLIASISPTFQVAVIWTPFLALMLSCFCGVTIPYPNLNKFWQSWMYHLDPYTRTLSAMLSTELHGLVIRCADYELTTFNPPSGQTCQEWAGDFVSSIGGYLVDGAATTACQYCQYAVGDEYFKPLNIRYETRWRDVWILFCYFIFNNIATLFASTFLRFAKR